MVMHVTCIFKPVGHDMICVRSRGDVRGRVATCMRWVCQREQAAGAGKEVNTAISERANVMGAHGNIMEHCGEVQPGGRALRAVIWR